MWRSFKLFYNYLDIVIERNVYKYTIFSIGGVAGIGDVVSQLYFE